jgi:hypothetical protein
MLLEEPRRMKERIESVLPNWMLSTTEQLLQSLEMP